MLYFSNNVAAFIAAHIACWHLSSRLELPNLRDMPLAVHFAATTHRSRLLGAPWQDTTFPSYEHRSTGSLPRTCGGMRWLG